MTSIIMIDMILLMPNITARKTEPLKNTIDAVKARQHFGELLDKADYRGESVVVKRAGKLKAAIVSIQDYEFIKQRNEARNRILATHRKMRKSFSQLGYKEAQALVNKTVKEVRGNKSSQA